MTLNQFALAFLAWADDEHLLSYKPRRATGDRPAERLLEELLPERARDAIRAAFRDNRIHYVGVAETKNRLVVAAPGRLTPDRRLPANAGSVSLDFQTWKAPDVLPARSAAKPQSTRAMIGERYPCGTSISTGDDISAGTLGCLVRDRQGRLLGLTCNHVVGKCNDADPDLPVVAPGLLDVQADGLDPFTLGHFHSLGQLTHGKPGNVATGANLDAALFAIRDPDAVTSMQRDAYDTPTTTLPPAAGMTVRKVGRTTGPTTGWIDSTSLRGVSVRMEAAGFKGRVYFDECFVVFGADDFALRGDSGSLIVSETRNGERAAIGIVFAVSADGSRVYAAPIDEILRRFDVELVGGHNAAATGQGPAPQSP